VVRTVDPRSITLIRSSQTLACVIYLTDADGIYPDEPSTYPTHRGDHDTLSSSAMGETVYFDVTGS
jgi:isopentenyl phosphate kinase